MSFCPYCFSAARIFFSSWLRKQRMSLADDAVDSLICTFKKNVSILILQEDKELRRFCMQLVFTAGN